MPIFFDKSNLTEDQFRRWDDATREYERVQQANIELRVQRLTPSQRSEYANHGIDTDAKIRESILNLARLYSQAGDPKSALFYRLLSGQAALPYPPPKSFSYPWYSVIETPGPHAISQLEIGGLVTDAGMGSEGGEVRRASIHQCTWRCTAANGAAQELMLLDAYLKSTVVKSESGDDSPSYEWTQKLLTQVTETYSRGPEFTVRYGEWPAFRLDVRHLNDAAACHQMLRRDARACVSLAPDQLSHVWTVFDVESLSLNARIGKAVSTGIHPKQRLQGEQAALNTLQNSVRDDFMAGLQATAVSKHQETLAVDIAAFEADPSGFDRVLVSLDRWCLSRIDFGGKDAS